MTGAGAGTGVGSITGGAGGTGAGAGTGSMTGGAGGVGATADPVRLVETEPKPEATVTV